MLFVEYKDYSKALEETKAKLESRTCVKGIQNYIWIVNNGTNDNISMGVNVSGTGDMSPKEAKRFAQCIEIAADIAEKFQYNGYAIK